MSPTPQPRASHHRLIGCGRRVVVMRRNRVALALCVSLVPFGTASDAIAAPNSSTTKVRASASSKEAEALLQAVKDASAYVESVRKEKFLSQPKVEVLAGNDFVERLRSEQKSDPLYEKDLRVLGQVLDALGLVPNSSDGKVVFEALLDSGVGGFYDPKTDVLVVKGGKVTPLVRAVLVHELTHALDDQLNNLDRPELDNVHDGSDEGFTFLTEGSARWVENQYRASVSAAERDDMDAEENRSAQESGALLKVATNPKYVNSLPFLILSLLAPYELGKQLIADIVAKEGTAGIDKAFKNPPVTAEQGRSYAAYSRHEPAIAVARPPVEGTLIDFGVLGESSLNALLAGLGDLGSDLTISSAARGWGGDQYVLYQPKTGGPCLRFDLAMDTPADLTEVETALRSWSRKHPKATVVKPAADRVRLTACG